MLHEPVIILVNTQLGENIGASEILDRAKLFDTTADAVACGAGFCVGGAPGAEGSH